MNLSFEADEMSYYFFLDEYILNLTVGGLHNFYSLSIFDIYTWITCLVLHDFKRNIYFLIFKHYHFFRCPSIWAIFLNNKCILIQGKTKNAYSTPFTLNLQGMGKHPGLERDSKTNVPTMAKESFSPE